MGIILGTFVPGFRHLRAGIRHRSGGFSARYRGFLPMLSLPMLSLGVFFLGVLFLASTIAPVALPVWAGPGSIDTFSGDAPSGDMAPVAGKDRFAALLFSRSNVRSGPGYDYPILWVYTRRGIPLRIIDDFGDWHRILDSEGQQGWLHKRLLSTRQRRAVIVAPTLARRHASDHADVAIHLGIGVMVDVLACADDWCRISVRGYRGWVGEKNLW